MQQKRISADAVAGALEHSGAVAAWIFGSAKDGEMREEADMDIAVLFGHKPDLDELAVSRARLQQTLGVEDIDLTPLDDASPILRFEALRGTRVMCADESRCAEFASLTAREYEDETYLLTVHGSRQ